MRSSGRSFARATVPNCRVTKSGFQSDRSASSDALFSPCNVIFSVIDNFQEKDMYRRLSRSILTQKTYYLYHNLRSVETPEMSKYLTKMRRYLGSRDELLAQ